MNDHSREHWVGTWASAQQETEPANLPPPPGLGDTTLRQIIHVSLGGEKVRVRFANTFGTVPLTIHVAHIARPAGAGAIVGASDRVLTFDGCGSVILAPGAMVVSDPLSFRLPPLSDLAITIHVQDASSAVTGHPGARCTSYLATGDRVAQCELPGASTAEHWYYLASVDVLAPANAAAIVCLGDSLTDGRGSTTDGNDRWTDILARRLSANADTAHFGVLNLGLGGNRVCADGLGPRVLSRLDRDVLGASSVRGLILLHGINDLGTRAASADGLIAAYEEIIARCHARNVPVFGGTLTPWGRSFYDTPALEVARATVNEWIRHADRFDAVIDFDAAVRDPADPTRLRTEADCGDHLHLNPTGYRMLGEAVDLSVFRPGGCNRAEKECARL